MAKKKPKPFEGEVMLKMWVTVPLEAMSWADAVEELMAVSVEDVRLVADDDIIDARVEAITVRDREAFEAGGL